MPSKFLNISTDNTLGGNSPSDVTVSSQKAIKEYVDAHSSGSPSWGSIIGTLSNQTDLQNALNAKANDSAVVKLTGNQTVADVKTFSSSPILPTPATSDDSTKGATTAFVVNVLKAIYPVGAVYIGTTSTCPLASFFGTWTLKSSGRVLQGADSTHIAGTTIEAGLPNITGSIEGLCGQNSTGGTKGTGAFTGAAVYANNNVRGPSAGSLATFPFDAANSNSIYGNSTTVQPPAYVVNIWERTA